jgi:hypothetical protein
MIFLDSALLNFVERCCHRFQRLTGRTNVWLAFQLTNLSIVVYFVCAGMYFLGSHGLTRLMLVAFCGGVLYLLTLTIFRVPLEALEASAYRRVGKGLRNPRRIRDVLLRLMFLALSFLLLAPAVFAYLVLDTELALLGYLLVVATTAVLYLVACDPLAPQAGRIAEWLRSASPSAQRQPVPVRAPESQRSAEHDEAVTR